MATDGASRDRLGKNARAFYDVHSAIIHNRSVEGSPFATGAAFGSGFDLARRSPFKILREGLPEDRAAVTVKRSAARKPEHGRSGPLSD